MYRLTFLDRIIFLLEFQLWFSTVLTFMSVTTLKCDDPSNKTCIVSSCRSVQIWERAPYCQHIFLQLESHKYLLDFVLNFRNLFSAGKLLLYWILHMENGTYLKTGEKMANQDHFSQYFDAIKLELEVCTCE